MHSLIFENAFTSQLPADPQTGSARRQIRDAMYSRVAPTPVAAPSLLHYSNGAAKLLGLSSEDCQSDTFLQVFAGNHQLEGMDQIFTKSWVHQML